MTITTAPGYGYADLGALMSEMTGDEKHEPAATSTLDVLWVLYDQVLAVDPRRTDDPDRDRFLLSKGHGPMAYYAVLAAKGFFDRSELRRFAEFGSVLGHHPDRMLVPGVEIGSGSLGHGLPLALGVVLGLRARGRRDPRVVVLVGDAELDEGSNHEAIAVAGRRGLGQLTAVVVDNASASYGWPGGIGERFAREGWAQRTVDGRDHEALREALTDTRPGRPLVVVAEVEPKG
ncbi:transketolase [Saccharopolyspora erythraea NRRL 2338]|uniref:Transketolase n=2 Tax=Saccharopolyspora erythraea TaxID=1836 RepID=A4FLM3_SACEN|nr:thiamine pyrophosphate-dependent enzyme [Saccharopolyspora erythraea]EQD83864.1 transketolase [Saccharopolyspora erythraea D]PFG98587.1 transketolase [Saccharopolyspora erythraea NRRL 2338]QRK88625.1 transketolase [Saccharopolyspora erythraea]CAM04948.1 putative transketolase [Saccharopolyspora erythraea NRRL 2338]